jgi:hypothetical protein
MEPARQVFAGRLNDGEMKAPEGMAAIIGDLPFVREYDRARGMDCFTSRWVPDESERATIAAGGSVLLRIYSNAHPAVSLQAWPAADAAAAPAAEPSA